MQNIFLASNISLLICFVATVVLAGVIFLHREEKKSSLVFFFLIVAANLWVVANLAANLTVGANQNDALLVWSKLSLFGPIFIPGLLILFAKYFSDEKAELSKWVLIFTTSTTFVLLALLPTSYNVEFVRVIDPKIPSFSMTPGILYTFYTIYLIIGVCYSFYIILKSFCNFRKEKKIQIKIVIIGLAGSIFSGLILSMLLPMYGYSNFVAIGPLSITIFLFFTSYAIIKYQLLEVKLIIAEITAYLLFIILVVEIFLSKTNTEVFFRILFFCVAFYGGQILIKSTQNDIKQKEELELLTKKLSNANAHLKDLDKMKDDFLSMASHELNTPLAAIEGYLSMMLEEGMGGDLQPKTRDYLDRMYKSSRRLGEIIKDLLNVSRIESGRIHIVYQEAQIEDLIKQSIAEVDSKLKEKGHEMCLDLPAEPLPKTWMDITRITEVIINFLGNAIKYTENGGHIKIGAKAEDSHILVWVKDDGRGIPQDKSERVFEKFTQVDVLKDEVKGTGLGMYISKKFVELHKGKIWYESEGEGMGTTFFFTLPISAEKPYDPNEDNGPVLR